MQLDQLCSVDEPRDNWRAMFFQRFLPLVQNASSLSEAALTLNKEIWSIWGITFKSNQTPEIMSPFQVPKSALSLHGPKLFFLCYLAHFAMSIGSLFCRLLRQDTLLAQG